MPPVGNDPFGVATFGSTAEGQAVIAEQGLELRIGAEVNATKYLRVRNYQYGEALNGRDTLDFDLVTQDGFRPLIGQEVVLNWRGNRIFGGSIESTSVNYFNLANASWRAIRVACVDWNAIADRRTHGEVYRGVLAGDIVRDLITKTLGADGIEAGSIADGPIIAQANYDFWTCGKILDDLSERTGLHWDIDDHKKLHFFERMFLPAPFGISTTAKVRKIVIGRTRAQYRNLQYFRGGKAVTSPQTELVRGDGTTRNHTLQFPIFEQPSSTRAGVSQSWGVRTIDTNKQWYWNKNDRVVSQDSAQPVLAAGEVMPITYRGVYQINQLLRDEAKTLERQAVEGGTGLYEAVITETSIDGEDLVTERNFGLMRRFGSIDAEISYETEEPGLAIGQFQDIALPLDGISGPHLIVGVQAKDFLLGQPRFTVKASSGELKGTDRQFWQRVFDAGNQPILGDEFIQIPVQILETVPLAESWAAPVELTAAQSVWIIDQHYLGECEVGA